MSQIKLTPDVLQGLDLFNGQAIEQIELIAQGVCNYNFRVTTHSDTFLFKVYGSHQSLFEREQEFIDLKTANLLGLAPKPLCLIHAADCPQSYIQWAESTGLQTSSVAIHQFIFGLAASDVLPLDSANLSELGQLVARLHQSSAIFLGKKKPADQRLFLLLEDYWKRVEKTPSDLARYAQLSKAIAGLALNHNVIVHGDLNPTNIILAPKGMTLVDWEFCDWGDAYFDLACVWVEFELSEQALQHFLYAYQNISSVDKVDENKLNQTALLYLGLCWLWHSPKLTTSQMAGIRQHYQEKLDHFLAQRVHLRNH